MNWENQNDRVVENAVRMVRDLENGELADALRQLSADHAAGREYVYAELCAEAAARLEIER